MPKVRTMKPARFAELRRRLGTQEAVAQAMGVDRTSVARWETGQHPIPPMALILLGYLHREAVAKTKAEIAAVAAFSASGPPRAAGRSTHPSAP